MKKISVSAPEEDNSLSCIYDDLKLKESEFFNEEFLKWFKTRIFPGDGEDSVENENKSKRQIIEN